MKRAGVILRGVRQRGIPRLHRVRRIELPGLGHPKLFQLLAEGRPFLELCRGQGFGQRFWIHADRPGLE